MTDRPSSPTRDPAGRLAAFRVRRPSVAEQRALGRALRDRVPRRSHAAWAPADRPDADHLNHGREAHHALDFNRATKWGQATPPRPIRWVLVRDPVGKRTPQAFFSTDPTLAPAEITAIFVRRWQVEITFSEVRAHLGVETQRQWSDRAIGRTTPALFGLYSLIAPWAENLLRQGAVPYGAAWYRKISLHIHRCHRRRPAHLDRRY